MAGKKIAKKPAKRRQTATASSTRRRSATQRNNQSQAAGLSPWVRWGCGLLICLGIAGYMYIQYYGVPAWYKTTQHRDAKKTHTTDVARIKPKFDFYQLLPKIEVPVSDAAPKTARKLPVTTPPVSSSNAKTTHSQTAATTYVLQVASFKQFADADTLKAKLSLLGFDVNVRHFKAANGQDWYRVWIGPYTTKQLAQQAQAQLSENQMHSLLRKAS